MTSFSMSDEVAAVKKLYSEVYVSIHCMRKPNEITIIYQIIINENIVIIKYPCALQPIQDLGLQMDHWSQVHLSADREDPLASSRITYGQPVESPPLLVF